MELPNFWMVFYKINLQVNYWNFQAPSQASRAMRRVQCRGVTAGGRMWGYDDEKPDPGLPLATTRICLGSNKPLTWRRSHAPDPMKLSRFEKNNDINDVMINIFDIVVI